MRTLAVVPNILSALRLALAAWFPFAPLSCRLAILITAGLTDFADGYIARRYRVTSWVGGLLDAIADKLFVLSVLLTFTVGDELRWWQALLLLTRDFAVGFIAAYAAAAGKWYAFRHMSARLPGKLTTAALFLFFILAVTLPARGPAMQAAFVTTASLSVLAAVDYLLQFFHARRLDRTAKPDAA